MAYEGKEIQARWLALQETSSILLQQLGPAFTATPTGHIQTDIAAVGSLSGLMILQESVNNLPDVIKISKTGDALIAEVYEGQNDVFRFLTELFIGNGIQPKMDMDSIKNHKPLLACEDMTKKLSSIFYQACFTKKLERKYYKFAAALAGHKLVMAGNSMKILPPLIGQNILFYYMVAGSKTVPHVESLWA
jgi:hypothetical protein